MPWSRDDIPMLDGCRALVTGANGGLGLQTALALAAKGAEVLMAARDQEKAARAEREIRAESPDAKLEVVELDLGSLDSIRAAARAVLETHPRIDILVNNAGLMAMPERRTADGFEMQLGVNHLGHWALTSRLMPALLRAPAARVVSVTSTAHHMGRAVDPANPHLEGRYGPWKSYLQRGFERAGVSAASLIAHPGLSNTDFQAHAASENAGDRWARFFHGMASRSGMEPAQGALSQLRAATDPGARGASSTARSGSTADRRSASRS
jgi:NAD(P)-dependent dehydrogenase (short-subunit alcohol dehydrogenase family)